MTMKWISYIISENDKKTTLDKVPKEKKYFNLKVGGSSSGIVIGEDKNNQHNLYYSL